MSTPTPEAPLRAGPPRVAVRALRAWVVAAGLLAVGCETAAPPAARSGPGGVPKADDLLVVDCLLPGQVRQLGGQMTYLTARRALKTSARDCEIRGGEYVAFDRASYATALKVWLPLAEQGDLAAQTYVGEIFEKGLGVPADHAAAAEWYRRAADKGHARAAINLGSLYEQGLGVPRDPARALDWYRRASGLKPLAFDLVQPQGPSPEETRLRAEVEDLRRQLQGKQAELDRTQRELETLRRALEQRRGEAEAERATLARLRQELADRQRREQTETAQVRELRLAIGEREGRLAARDREIAELRASVATLETTSREQRAGVEQLRAEVTDLRRAVETRQAELDRTRAELAGVRRALEQRSGEADADRRALEALRKELAERRQRDQAGSARLRELEQAVTEREARLGARDREVADLRASLARLEAASRAQSERVEALKRQAAAPAAAPQIHLLEPELLATRDGQGLRAQAADRTLLVVGRVQADGGIASLTINGRDERLAAGDLFKAQVALGSAREERVRIVAVDRGGRKAALDFVVVQPPPGATRATGGADAVGHPRPPQPITFGAYHALVIGNNDYRQMPALKTAVNDAREVARVLEREYGFNVRLLLNATRYEILAALNDLRERLTERDNLLVYYAGHGELDERNQRGHWLPVDAEPNSSANWISNISVTDVLNAMTVRQLLVVADSCYSGTLTRSALGRLESGLSEPERVRLMQVMAERRSRMVLTSGGLEPVLDSAGGGHSAFAQSFLTVLRANVGVLPGQEMFQHVRLRVASVADRLAVRQVPEYAPIKYAGHESGDFFFVRRAN